MIDNFNISTMKIDFSKLDKEIEQYKTSNFINPYIFMNADTIEELIKIIGYSIDGLNGKETSALCGRYKGYKVFCDPAKKFGEVELR